MRPTQRASIAVAVGVLLAVSPLSAAGTTQPDAKDLKTVPATAVQKPAPAVVPATAATTPEAPQPQGYTYDPAHRRDPFVTLLRRGTDTEAAAGARPGGLMGLSAGEITLKGVLASRVGYVAILKGADNKTYIVHPGDKLLDGTIRTIAPDAMVILQQVNDPLSQQKEREVRKELRQMEEAR